MGTLYFATRLCLHDRGLQRHGSHYMARSESPVIRSARSPICVRSTGSASSIGHLHVLPPAAGQTGSMSMSPGYRRCTCGSYLCLC